MTAASSVFLDFFLDDIIVLKLFFTLALVSGRTWSELNQVDFLLLLLSLDLIFLQLDCPSLY